MLQFYDSLYSRLGGQSLQWQVRWTEANPPLGLNKSLKTISFIFFNIGNKPFINITRPPAVAMSNPWHVRGFDRCTSLPVSQKAWCSAWSWLPALWESMEIHLAAHQPLITEKLLPIWALWAFALVSFQKSTAVMFSVINKIYWYNWYVWRGGWKYAHIYHISSHLSDDRQHYFQPFYALQAIVNSSGCEAIFISLFLFALL